MLVPLSSNMHAPNVLLMTPYDYLAALSELARLSSAGPHSRPGRRSDRHIAVRTFGPACCDPAACAGVPALSCVSLSRRFEPMLRLVALAAIALTPIGLIYLAAVRYNLVMWFLMALVVTAWIRIEGLALVDFWRPGWRAACRSRGD